MRRRSASRRKLDRRRGDVALVSDSSGFGGAESYLATLVTQLRGRHRFVAVLGDGAADETRSRLGEAGAELVTVRGLRRMPTPVPVLRLARTLRALEPAFVHVNLTDQGDGLGPLLAARLARLPILATLHLVISPRSRWRERVSAHALRVPHLVIGVSEFVAEYAGGAGARAHAVLNGIAAIESAPQPRAELGLPEGAFVVGGVGRLHDQKGWDVLVSAARIVHRTRPEIRFAVIGEGAEEARLVQESAGHVQFLGYRRDASALLPAFDLVAVPSRYEAFGLTALEAMHAGVPVVAADVGGLSEVVGDCGRLVPPEDPDALAAAILDLASDRARAVELTERASARAAFFTPERMAAETEQLYEVITGGVRPPAPAIGAPPTLERAR